jgi:hypothetical protein
LLPSPARTGGRQHDLRHQFDERSRQQLAGELATPARGAASLDSDFDTLGPSSARGFGDRAIPARVAMIPACPFDPVALDQEPIARRVRRVDLWSPALPRRPTLTVVLVDHPRGRASFMVLAAGDPPLVLGDAVGEVALQDGTCADKNSGMRGLAERSLLE